MADENNLRVPQKNSASISHQSVMDIMNAYNTQSKIQLYDESSALSNDGISGVSGRDIPLSALRARANATDESGNAISLPRSRLVKEAESRKAIASAYNKMKGVDEDESEYEGNYGEESDDMDEAPVRDLSGIKRFHADYVEDMPEDDEGLLEILELAIRNARANLEMLESLYAALSPS